MNETKHPQAVDMLSRIFQLQAELNDYVFMKNGLTDGQGATLNMEAIRAGVNDGRLKVNDLPNVWLGQYSRAMAAEINELDEELLWKWWSKDELDMQNVRVELIDILHFLVSAMICAGLSAEQVFDIYQQKHGVNINRQDSGYNKADKTEQDNRKIR